MKQEMIRKSVRTRLGPSLRFNNILQYGLMIEKRDPRYNLSKSAYSLWMLDSA